MSTVGKEWARAIATAVVRDKSGGRFGWHLGDANDLLVAWKSTPGEDPGEIEYALIGTFVAHYGQRPYANRNRGHRPKY